MKKSFALSILLDIFEWNILIMREMRILVVVNVFILEWNDLIMKELQISIIANMYMKIWFIWIMKDEFIFILQDIYRERDDLFLTCERFMQLSQLFVCLMHWNTDYIWVSLI